MSSDVDLAGRRARTWTYGGRLPGRELRLKQGEPVRVRLVNALEQPTSIHWHGIRLRNDADGVPGFTQEPIAIADEFVYAFTPPDAGTYFFLPHVGVQLDRGLYAPLIVEPRREPLAYDREAVLMFDDWLDGLAGTPDRRLARLRADGMDMAGMHSGAGATMNGPGTAASRTRGGFRHTTVAGRPPGPDSLARLANELEADAWTPVTSATTRCTSSTAGLRPTLSASPSAGRSHAAAADQSQRGHDLLRLRREPRARGRPRRRSPRAPVRTDAVILAMGECYDVGLNQVTVMGGASGSSLRTYALPDVDPGGTGDRRPSGFGNAVTVLGDVGRCTSSPGAGAPCPPADVSATADGIVEHVVSASGVDVDVASGVPNAALNNNLGVVYIFDGATGALLKRVEMPAADRAEQVGFSQDARFGRSVLSPGDIVNAVGDLGTDGRPDLLVAATDYSETPATAAPGSQCANSAVAKCTTAGRVYLYSGAQFLSGGAASPLDVPAKTIRSPLSQPDSPTPFSPFSNSGGFGSLLIPIGDAGTCPTPNASNVGGANPGAQCATRTGINTFGGRPDFATGSSEYDSFGMDGVGRVIEIDGETLSTIQTIDYPEPSPGSSWGQAQNGTVFPAIGDAVGTTAPDFDMPDIQWAGTYAAQGRGFVISGQPSQQGSTTLGEIPTRLSDPTPQNAEQFSLSAAGFGDVGGVNSRPEILVGGIGPHNPGTDPGVINDVHIFDPTTGRALQSITAPDAQGGEAFGVSLAPLGDINGDGFKDFAVGAGFYDVTSGTCQPCANAGRLYIFRSDDSPAATTPPAPPPPAAVPPPPAPPAVPAPALTRAGRTIELAANRAGVRRRTFVTLRGAIEAFTNRQGCEAGVTVRIQRRRPGSPRYVTIATLRSSRTGAFTKRTRVTQTSIYRARVAETTACLGAASSGERVTATSRKTRR